MQSPEQLLEDIQEYRNIQETLESMADSKDMTLAVDVGCQVCYFSFFSLFLPLKRLKEARVRVRLNCMNRARIERGQPTIPYFSIHT
jgi:hypothetical protein